MSQHKPTHMCKREGSLRYQLRRMQRPRCRWRSEECGAAVRMATSPARVVRGCSSVSHKAPWQWTRAKCEDQTTRENRPDHHQTSTIRSAGRRFACELSGDSALLVKTSVAFVASDAAHVTTQDGVHVPLKCMALMPGTQVSVAASSMPPGRMPGGSHVNIAGESDPQLQLSAASDAANAGPRVCTGATSDLFVGLS